MIKIYFKYPWKVIDSSYYRNLLNFPPKEVEYVNKKDFRVKILGDGQLKHALKIRAHAFSRSALEKIKSAGGTAETIQAAAKACA